MDRTLPPADDIRMRGFLRRDQVPAVLAWVDAQFRAIASGVG